MTTPSTESTAPSTDRAGGVCPVAYGAAAFRSFDDAYLADPYAVVASIRRDQPVFYSDEIDHWVVVKFGVQTRPGVNGEGAVSGVGRGHGGGRFGPGGSL